MHLLIISINISPSATSSFCNVDIDIIACYEINLNLVINIIYEEINLNTRKSDTINAC